MKRSIAYTPEAALQRAATRYLEHLERQGAPFTHAHIPNEGKRSARSGAELKRQGMRAGLPDLVLWLRGGRVLHLELKSAAGRLSAAQRAFGERLVELGHRYEVIKAGTIREVLQQVEAILAEEGVRTW